MKKIKIGINGPTSTGKTTFLGLIAEALSDRGIKSEIITDLAIGCPLPIKKDHTIESTIWIALNGMSKEIEAQHNHDVVLVDRSVIDCWAYFNAVCRGRYNENNPKLITLKSIITGWLPTYDFLYNTVINEDMSIENQKGRDMDVEYRNRINSEMEDAIKVFKVSPRRLRYGDAVSEVSFILSQLNLL